VLFCESWETRGSDVSGHGVFALRPLRKGDKVLECRGRLVSTAEVYDGLRAMQVGPDLWLAEDLSRPDASDYINHGCSPNLGFVDGSLWLVALRDIEPGEELLWDYSTAQDEPGWAVPCRCGSPDCRGMITGYSDLSPADAERLRPIVLAWLRRP
jgi:SET domain-containing protein